MTHARFAFALCAVSGLAALGCAAERVEVTRVVAADDVVRAGTGKLHAVAVVHGNERTPIPPGAKIQPGKVTIDRSGVYVHKLAPDDVIVTDDAGRIVAVRSAGTPPIVTQFVPGTATSPEGSDEVRGTLVDTTLTIPLREGDRIELSGTLDEDDPVPGGGHVATTRKTSMLVGGIVLTTLAYLPTAYVGVSSPRASDRVLLAPIAGPWIDYAGRDRCVPPKGSEVLPVDPCIGETASRVALIISGVIQSFGGLLTVIALPSTTYVERVDRGVASAPSWTVVPTATPHGGGGAIVGTF
jgi:hypothetical protein